MLAFGRRAGLSLAVVCALALPAAAHAARYPGVAEQQNVPIVMRDGTTLYANVFRPAGLDAQPIAGSFPTILTQTPYNKDTGSGTPSGSSSQLTQLSGKLDSV